MKRKGFCLNKVESYSKSIEIESKKIIKGEKNDFTLLTFLWLKFFSYTLKYRYGFNKKSIEKMFEWGNDGHNWKDLHIENTEYNNKDRNDILRAFVGEVNYIYDRISLDRLFRCHWLYNNIVNKQ